MSPATLSLVINGKKGLSPLAADRIVKRLGFSKTEAQVFSAAVSAQHARSKIAREAARAQLEALEKNHSAISLQLDAFQIVSDWHHFALIQLVKLPSFREDATWIGKQLSIRAEEAQVAIDRLLRLELLSRNADGKLQAVEMVFAPDGIPSEAIRKFHRQVMEKAMTAITLQSIDERYLNTTLLPIKRSSIPEARALIKEFHKTFTDKFTTEQDGDSVYAMSVQLFNLTPELISEEK